MLLLSLIFFVYSKNSLYDFCPKCKQKEENKHIEDLKEIEQKCPLIWTSCGHYFHSHCFDENNSKCPECGKTIAWTSKLNKEYTSEEQSEEQFKPDIIELEPSVELPSDSIIEL